MTFALDRLCGRLFDEPLLYHPRKAEAMLRALGPRLTGAPLAISNGEGSVDHIAFANGRPSAGVVGDRMARSFDQHGFAPFDVVDGVAIIPIEGTLVHKGGYIGSSSGETSYQGLQSQIAIAERRADIKGVVFEVDSFGGEVSGAFDTSAMMRSLSAKKPTISILTDYAFSAGYLLASQARQIVMPEFGGVGSIGVLVIHAEISGQLAQEGIVVTMIHAGEHKVDGNPYQPLPAHERDQMQARVDAMRERFATEVAAGRRARLTKAKALATEARTFSSAEALEAGLVDAIASPRAAFLAFLAEIKRI